MALMGAFLSRWVLGGRSVRFEAVIILVNEIWLTVQFFDSHTDVPPLKLREEIEREDLIAVIAYVIDIVFLEVVGDASRRPCNGKAAPPLRGW
jgi:hypothetical protein